MNGDGDDDKERPKMPNYPTARDRRATLLFRGAVRGATKADCRFTYGGVVPPSGVPRVRVSCIGNRWDDWRRAAYRHWFLCKLFKEDQVITVCGNELCGDKRHLFVVPRPKAAKPSRLSCAVVAANTAATVALGGSTTA